MLYLLCLVKLRCSFLLHSSHGHNSLLSRWIQISQCRDSFVLWWRKVMMCFVEKVLVFCSFRGKQAEWKTFYWIVIILSSPAQESKIIAIDSFSDIATCNSSSGNLKGSPWTAWNSKIKSSTPVTLANLNMQILVWWRTAENFLNF